MSESRERMIVAAARALARSRTVLVGVGLPGIAANLARAVHRPGLVLVYESGAIGAKPPRLPLSIGDGMLQDTADLVVSLPEMFAYWIQAGRLDVGFVGAAQVDPYANLNSTVIGTPEHPVVRLPGAGGASAIAAGCRRTIVVAGHDRRTFVERLDFLTTLGHGSGPGSRERLRFPGGGPELVVTDLGELRPHPETRRLRLTALHEGVDVETARDRTGWDLEVAPALATIPAPTAEERAALHRLLESEAG